jgi:hypothetical protein
MKNNNLYHNAVTETPKPDKVWLKMSNADREKLISNFLCKKNEYSEFLYYESSSDSGEITFSFIKDLDVDKRCIFLLDFELELKKLFGQFIFISIKPLGDKNSLRRLRGIDITKKIEES